MEYLMMYVEFKHMDTFSIDDEYTVIDVIEKEKGMWYILAKRKDYTFYERMKRGI